jgi:cytochrome c oxidase assembly protein subunit 15
MTRATSVPELSSRLTRYWLLTVAALVFVMVLVGGATRLTESGLSIVEWRPVSGVLPPLSAAQWQAEFEKYQTIPQYQMLNRGMSLDQFKTIFWWEWAHRLLGRVIGGAFLLPFLWFLWRGHIEPRLRAPLCAIFALGAVQGVGGWWMVASGLAERTSVSQYRLAFHLTLACLIYAALLWAAQRTRPRPALVAAARIRIGAVAFLALVLLQIYLGALVAGLHAGLIYNTWPLIDGRLLPDAAELLRLTPAWRNLFENGHRPIRPSDGGVCTLAPGVGAPDRRGRRRARFWVERRAGAGGGGDGPGEPRHPDAGPSSAACASAPASGDGDGGLDHRRVARGGANSAASTGTRRAAACG